ncbi:hypothetical protein [Anaerotignum neopropionicum]|nr:hypothetical protein [Anaerotignum neopropionicum]
MRASKKLIKSLKFYLGFLELEKKIHDTIRERFGISNGKFSKEQR